MPRGFYTIARVINNNCLLIKDDGEEMIVISKGIGFKRTVGETLPKDMVVEKRFKQINDKSFAGQTHNPDGVVRQTAQIMDIIDRNIDAESMETSLVSLSNHIAAMIIRIENDETLPNPFHNETKILYRDSYDVALMIARDVEREMALILPKSEIDFLTLYVHGLRRDGELSYVARLNAIVYEITDVLKSKYGIVLDKDSVAYARFIVHIKFVVQRVLNKEKFQNIELIDQVYEQYHQYHELSFDIAHIIESALDTQLDRQELTYIMLHLARLNVSVNE